MKLLDRYILGRVWPPAFLAASVISFVVMGGALRTQMRALTERVPLNQIALWDIVRISVYALPTLAGFILPVAFLLSVIFVFSRMAQRNEMTVMKAAGIPLRRIVLPVALLGVAVSAGLFLVADRAQPWAYWKLMGLVSSELPLRICLRLLPTGVMHQFGEWRVYLGRLEPDGTLRNIVILQPETEGANAFYADSAQIVDLDGRPHLKLKRGYFIPTDPRQYFSFESLLQPMPAPASQEIPDKVEGMTLAQLRVEEQGLTRQWQETGAVHTGGDLRNIRLEIKNRLAFPLMFLAFSVIGPPVGARARRFGQSYAFSVGLVIIVAYFVLRKAAEPAMLLPLSWTVLLGLTPNLLLLFLGTLLIWREDRV